MITSAAPTSTATNSRDRREPACAPRRSKIPKAARLRPAKTKALTVRAASFHFTALHETVRTHCERRRWADTSSLRLRARLRCAPVALAALRRTASASTEESAKWLRANATAPGKTPIGAKLNFGSAAGWHEGTADATLLSGRRCGSHLRGWASALLPGLHTTHIVCLVIRSSFPHKFCSCRQLPAGGALRHGIYVTQYGVVCRPAAEPSR